MQKGFAPILILVGLLVAALVAGGAYYYASNKLSYFRKSPNSKQPIFNEEYCHKFNYNNCPSGCEVGPSNPITQDIGCHAKGAHKAKISSQDTDETATWKTYQDSTYKYSIKYPDDWVLVQGKDFDGNVLVALRWVKAEKAGFSSRQLPELIIGLGGPYSTSGAVCSNQICDETKKETVNVDEKAYTFPIIEGAVGLSGDITKPQFDFYAFTFPISHKKISISGYSEPISLNVYSSYKNLEEEKIIFGILSTFKFTQ